MIIPPHAFHIPQVSVDGTRLVDWLLGFALGCRMLYRLIVRRK